MLDFDPESVCRDEDCEFVGLHRKHRLSPQRNRAKQRQSTSPKPPWLRDDPDGLDESINKAVSASYPTHFSAIVRAVRDDYGNVHERTVYRRVAKAVAEGRILKLDLNLTFATYIKPDSKLTEDPDDLREYMLNLLELKPATKQLSF